MAGHREVHALEEDVLLDREIHARLDVVEHVRPVADVDVAGHLRRRTRAQQIDVLEENSAAVDLEPRLHVGAEFVVRLDLHAPVAERRGSPVRVDSPEYLHVEVRADNTPGRGVIVVYESALARDDKSGGRRQLEARRLRLRLRARRSHYTREAVTAGELLDTIRWYRANYLVCAPNASFREGPYLARLTVDLLREHPDQFRLVYRSVTDFPMIGRLVPDPWLHARVTMRAERSR